MNESPDTVSQLADVTAEMASLQDLAGKRLADLLELRGVLIRRLIDGGFHPGDHRLKAIVENADLLQERLQRRTDSIRRELAGVRSIGALMNAVQSTLAQPDVKALDIRG